jgi:hypothetical protein
MNPLVSMIRKANATKTSDVRVLAVLRGIREGRWRELVEPIPIEFSRAQAAGLNAREIIKPMKNALPGVLFAGRFSRRHTSGLISYSGLLVADADDLALDRLEALRSQIRDDEHVFSGFTSPSGRGFKLGFVWVVKPVHTLRVLPRFKSIAGSVMALRLTLQGRTCREGALLVATLSST